MSYNVLVADDNPNILDLTCMQIEDILRGHGIKPVIHSARDGIELEDIASKVEPDLILTDVEMGRTSGIEAALAVRGSGYSGPIIVTSCCDDYQKMAEAAGFAFLLKTGESSRLEAAIERATGLMQPGFGQPVATLRHSYGS